MILAYCLGCLNLRIDYLAGRLVQVKQCIWHCLAHACSLHQFRGGGWNDLIAGQACLGGLLRGRHFNVTLLAVEVGNDWLATFLLDVDAAGRAGEGPSKTVPLLELLLELGRGSEVVEDLLERGLSHGVLANFVGSLVLLDEAEQVADGEVASFDLESPRVAPVLDDLDACELIGDEVNELLAVRLSKLPLE